MTTRAEHRARAEALLEESNDYSDDAYAATFIAKAQVHATLALSASDGDEAVPGFWQQRP